MIQATSGQTTSPLTRFRARWSGGARRERGAAAPPGNEKAPAAETGGPSGSPERPRSERPSPGQHSAGSEGREPDGLDPDLRQAWQIARALPALTPQDTAESALDAFNLHRVDALPVGHDSALVGYVTRQGVLDAVGGLTAWHDNRAAARQVRCESALRPFTAVVSSSAGVNEMARALDGSKAPILPVLGEGGRLFGCVLPADLSTSPTSVRLPLVGGMATPFGVYLTTDGLSGGAGFWALVSSGVMIGLCLLLADYLDAQIMAAVNASSAHGGPLAFWAWQPTSTHDLVSYGLTLLIFLTLIRFGPVAGFHAAEHQTVHALEAGEPLTPDRVRAKPRVHPRCGTNFLVLFWLAYCLEMYAVGLQGNSSLADDYVLPLGLMVIFMLRLSIGGFAQQYFTTRPATDRQIASGILAARQLTERYARQGSADAPLWRRIWGMGLFQVAIGSGGTIYAAQGIEWAMGHWARFGHLLHR